MTLTVIEYAARRCQICASPHAFFGFGPPFTDTIVYACQTHRLQLEQSLTAAPPVEHAPPPAPSAKQGTLF